MADRRPGLLLYCQHSLGVGHLVRSFALAEALAERFAVVFLSGAQLPRGTVPPPGIRLVALPPLGLEGGRLVSRDRRRTAERALELRRRTMLDVVGEIRPRVVLVELFPFGRRKFRGEIVPMLEAARGGPRPALVASSLRDILVAGRDDQAEHDRAAIALANALLDVVLVHADPAFARIEESLRSDAPIEVQVRYTGFVTSSTAVVPVPDQDREPRVVVTAGGGRVGGPLLEAAIAAQPAVLREAGLRMTLAGGAFLDASEWRALRRTARGRPGLTLRRSIPDLAGTLARTRGSVSQCGYNTAMDLLRARVPALVVPFADPGEDEQVARAERLARLDAVRLLHPRELTPERLAEEVARLRPPGAAARALDLGGAAATARLLGHLASDGALAAQGAAA